MCCPTSETPRPRATPRRMRRDTGRDTGVVDTRCVDVRGAWEVARAGVTGRRPSPAEAVDRKRLVAVGPRCQGAAATGAASLPTGRTGHRTYSEVRWQSQEQPIHRLAPASGCWLRVCCPFAPVLTSEQVLPGIAVVIDDCDLRVSVRDGARTFAGRGGDHLADITVTTSVAPNDQRISAAKWCWRPTLSARAVQTGPQRPWPLQDDGRVRKPAPPMP